MRWPSWRADTSTQHRMAIGLDVDADACHAVMLSGGATQPETVCGVAHLDLPAGWLVQGEVLAPEPLGQWLRHWWTQTGHTPQGLYVGLTDAWVMKLSVPLPANLSSQDVAFQLQAEVQAHVSDPSLPWSMDYRSEADASSTGSWVHEVQAVPQAVVDSWQRTARVAGLSLQALESSADAGQRSQHQVSLNSRLRPQVLSLAGRAWTHEGLNFLPHRAQREALQRRRWLRGMGVWGAAGVAAATCGAITLNLWGAYLIPSLHDAQQVTHAWSQAQHAHALATALQQRRQAQMQWLQAQKRLQAQSVLWSRVLSQSAQGLWVASVQQQGVHWSVQGEALSAPHAQQLLAQLKALDIWGRPPVLSQLRSLPSSAQTGLTVWHFRVEADLKAEGQP